LLTIKIRLGFPVPLIPVMRKRSVKIVKKTVKSRQRRKTGPNIGSAISSVWNTGNRLLDSQISVNTPFGGLGYSWNKGLSYVPAGQTGSMAMTSTASTGKRNYYYAATAPPTTGFAHGTRIIGSQVHLVVTSTNTNSNTGIDAHLSPDFFGGQMALDARNYSRYVFRDIWFEYLPDVAVGYTAAGVQTMVVGYYPDGDADNYQSITYQTLAGCEQNTTWQVWAPGSFHVVPNQEFLYYTEYDTTNAAAIRQTSQGMMGCKFQSAATATVSDIGTVYIHYVLDLYGRSGDYGFTISLNDKALYIKYLRDIFLQYPEALGSRDLAALQRLLTPPRKASQQVDAITSLLKSTKDEKEQAVGKERSWRSVV